MKLNDAIRLFAVSIVSEVAARHNLQPVDLLKPGRFAHIVAARRESMVTLKAAGLSAQKIASVFNVDRNTVLHHLNTSRRNNRYREKKMREKAELRAAS